MTAIDISTAPIAGELRDTGFTGRIVEPGDSGYDAARADWNGAIDRLPAAVAFAADAEDVAAAIRAGGHSVSGRSVRTARSASTCVRSARSTSIRTLARARRRRRAARQARRRDAGIRARRPGQAGSGSRSSARSAG